LAEPSEEVTKPPVRLLSRTDETPILETLPQPLTSLVGRDRAAASVRALLAEPGTRLVTLTGTGGIGKTRLAFQVANDGATDFPDGIAFVSLSALTDPEQVLPALAQALGVIGPGIHSTEERLTRLLDGQRMLVILDNFEHVMAAAPAITTLLQSTRTVVLLVTSRIPLHISGEHEFAVPPLELPSERSNPDEIARSSACELFVARSRAVRDDFAIDASNAVTVLDICRRLGGVPLAIELAAARSKALPPAALLQQLSRDPDLLSGGPSDHPARHQTMRGAIQWSYDLLSPLQQRLFRQLSVFAGGCTLDAAETITGAAGVAKLVDGLTALIDAGLLRQEPEPDGSPRYRMLDLIRRFGISQLTDSGELDNTVAAFAAWCIDLAQQAGAAFTGDGPGIWAQTLAREIDNFRSAIALLDSTGDPESVLRLATALAPLWTALGHQREGLQLLRSTLEQFDEQANPEAVMRARLVAARLATSLDNFPLAAALATAAGAEAMRTDDRAAEAGAHFVLGNLARGVGDQDTAWSHYEAALEIVTAAGDQYNIGYTLVQLAKLGDLGSPDHPADPEDLAAAEERCRDGLAIYQYLRNDWGIARAENHLAYLHYKGGRYTEAVEEAARALELFQKSGNLSEGSQCVENIADVAGATGASELAARLYGMAESLQERFGTPMWPVYRIEYAQEVARVRVRLTAEQMDAAWDAGRRLSDDVLIAEAIAAAQQLAIAPPPSTTPSPLPSGLTSREVDVLRLLATGATNPEIAETLFISVTTVKGHVQSIMRKLDMNSRSALAAWAVRTGIASPG
jgi:non-specific serine/threonine protein kinase